MQFNNSFGSKPTAATDFAKGISMMIALKTALLVLSIVSVSIGLLTWLSTRPWEFQEHFSENRDVAILLSEFFYKRWRSYKLKVANGFGFIGAVLAVIWQLLPN